jgi:hypothetical protein
MLRPKAHVVEKSAVPVGGNCKTTGGELDIIVDIYQIKFLSIN